jgi:hypothetical protein
MDIHRFPRLLLALAIVCLALVAHTARADESDTSAIASTTQGCETSEQNPALVISPVEYDKTVGPAGAKIYIHKDFPRECTSGNLSSCLSPSFLIPGDVVGISKLCRDWSYVSYLGATRDTFGWVATSSLRKLETPIDDSDKEPCLTPQGVARYSRSHTVYHFNGEPPESTDDVLDIWDEGAGGACFELTTSGPNGHECGAAGRLTRDRQGVLSYGQGQCLLTIQRKPDSLALKASRAWRRWGAGGVCPQIYGCGMYGSIESGTFAK